MKLLFLILAIGALASSLTSVNDKNFKEVVLGSGKFTLVDFYADWCRHCAKLMPTMEEVAELFKDEPDIQIVKINGDEDGKKMSRKYDVPGYPMLLMFHGSDKPVEFDGMRDTEAISNFIQQVSGIRLGQKKENELAIVEKSKVSTLDDRNFEEMVLRANHKTVVMFSAPWCKYCKEIMPAWEKLANEIYDSDDSVVKFGKVELTEENKSNCEKVMQQFRVNSLPTILFFDPARLDADGLRRPVVFKDDRDLASLIGFVNDETGLARNSEGKLYSNAGRILVINESLEKESPEEIIERLAELEQRVKQEGRDALVFQDVLFYNDDVKMIPYYRKLLHKVVEEDMDFIHREFARLGRMIETEEKNVERSAYDNMQKRFNVLKAFVSSRTLAKLQAKSKQRKA